MISLCVFLALMLDMTKPQNCFEQLAASNSNHVVTMTELNAVISRKGKPARRMTLQQKDAVLSALKKGYPVFQVAKLVGFASSGIYRHARQNKIPIDSTRGQFKATAIEWTPETWNTGHFTGTGSKTRFSVFRPDYPRSIRGWALRAHVVWWLHHGQVVPLDMELHHKDEDKFNDSLENLELLTRSEHRRRHQPKPYTVTSCATCHDWFAYMSCRDADRVTKYCGQKCYHKAPKSEESKIKQSASLVEAHKRKPQWINQ